MDVERSWHETGAALAKLFLAVLTIAAAVAAGIFAVGRPSIDDIAIAEERLDRIGILKDFVDTAVPTDDHVPRPLDTLMAFDRNQAISLFSHSSGVVMDLALILEKMVPLAQEAQASGDPNAWFLKMCGAGPLGNFLEAEQARRFGQTFVAAANNIYAIQTELKTAGVSGKAANDLTIRQLVLLNTLLGHRYFLMRNLAGAIRDSTAIDPWQCEGGVGQVRLAGEWNLDKREGPVLWSLESSDPEIVLLARAHPADLTAIKVRFERKRHALISAFVSEPTLKVTGFLPPLGFKLGVALFPGMLSIALLIAIAQIWVLSKNMSLPNAKVPTTQWQQRVSGYFVFPIPSLAGGTVLETFLSAICWLALPVLCTVVRTFAIDRLSSTRFMVPGFGWDRSAKWVRLDDIVNEVMGYVPPVFQYQVLSVYFLYAAIICTILLIVLSTGVRRQGNRLIEHAAGQTRADSVTP